MRNPQEYIDGLCGSEEVKIVTGELSASERQLTFSDFGFAEENGFTEGGQTNGKTFTTPKGVRTTYILHLIPSSMSRGITN